MTEDETVLQDYKLWLQTQRYSLNTIHQYSLLFKKFILKEPTQENVEQFLRKRTNNQVRAFLKNFKEYAELRGMILDYKVPKLKGRKDQKNVDYLNQEEYELLIENISEPHINLLVQALVESCCRISEILQWTSLNIDFKRLTVRGIGKGRKPYEAMISQDTADKLAILSESALSEKEKLWRINRQTAWKKIRKYGHEILDKQLNPHMLKATGLSILYNQGVPFEVLKDYARHDSFDTTMRYVHTFDKAKAKLKIRKIIDT